jgi:quercetin dioxygenase-like cupin family protein
MQNQILPFTNNTADAPAYWSAGILWIINATSESTGGTYSLIEELIPQGPSAPPHIHPYADEGFYILEGEATFIVNNDKISVTKGSFLSVPRGTIHSFSIDTAECRLLNWYTPGGFEHVIAAMSTKALQRTLPPENLIKEDLMSGPPPALAAIVKEYPTATTIYMG